MHARLTRIPHFGREGDGADDPRDRSGSLDSWRSPPPNGIDDFVDNLGGQHLEAAIGAVELHARIVLSGTVSQDDDEPVVGPRNLGNLSVTRSDVLAFVVTEEMDLAPEFFQQAAGWLATGALRSRETVVDGLENTLEAFFDLMRGENVGKVVVAL